MQKTEKIIYGSGRFGSSLLLNLVSFLTFYLYFEIFYLDPILNGVANAVGKFTIAFSGFIFGYQSDKTHTKIGRRKPFIIIGAPCLAISFILLYVPHIFGLNIIKLFGISIGNEISLFIYLLFFISSFHFFYGFLLSPFQAWMPELTKENERIEVSTYQNLFNVGAIGVSSFIAFFVPVTFTREGLPFLPYLVLIFGIVEICGYILPVLKLKEDSTYKAQFDLKTELKITWEK